MNRHCETGSKRKIIGNCQKLFLQPVCEKEKATGEENRLNVRNPFYKVVYSYKTGIYWTWEEVTSAQVGFLVVDSNIFCPDIEMEAVALLGVVHL